MFAIVQQVRAQSKLDILQSLSQPKSKVFRDGTLLEIPVEQIVPGDIIKLDQGDIIPADAKITYSLDLKVNEASLTGESDELTKSVGEKLTEDSSSLLNRQNMVFRGTYVARGTAKVLVIKTGTETELGKISQDVKTSQTGEILLRRKINILAKYLGIVVLIYLNLALSYRMIVLFSSGELFVDGILNLELASRTIVRGLITAMSVMPINIPLLATIILLTGVLVLAKQGVIIRDLSAIETLGRVSIVCTDKTGTLTKNEMTVKWIYQPTSDNKESIYGVTGTGVQPIGKIISFPSLPEGGQNPDYFESSGVNVDIGSSLELLLVSGFLNNDGIIDVERTPDTKKKEEHLVYRTFGDSTDLSLLSLFIKSNLDNEFYLNRFQEILGYSFDSKMKRMTRIFRDNDLGKYVAFTKGATEVILPQCTFATKDKLPEMQELTNNLKSTINEKIEYFASSAHRVISFAYKYFDEMPPKNENARQFFESSLIYLGFVAINDPPREGVRKSVDEAARAGIKTVIITGDSEATAKSIAMQTGILKEDELSIEGNELTSLSDEDLNRLSVVARVSPNEKKLLVQRYQSQGHIVAMTGDGVNDGPALSAANASIAMGITGTDVAKQIADMIITDDSFNSVVSGIRYGRGLFQKIRSVIFFFIAVNLGEAIVYGTAFLIPGFYLFNSWQQIYIFMVAHSLPPFALVFDRLNKKIMNEKPRDSEGLFNKPLTYALVLFSVPLAIMFFFTYFGTIMGYIPFFETNKLGITPDFTSNDLLNATDWAQAKARTMLHTVAFIAECTLVLSLRRLNNSIISTIRRENNWIIWPFILLVPIAHILMMYVPAIQIFMKQTTGINLEIIYLTSLDWVLAIILGLIPIAFFELYKVWISKKKQYI